FCSSTIWMRRPSRVMSRRIWFFIAASFGSDAMSCSTFILSCSRRAISARRCSACSACRLSVRLGARTSPSFTWPVVRDRSVPALADALDDDRLELLGIAGHLLATLDVPFELGEGRAITGIQHLAAELDRHLRRVALHAREQRRLDALQLLRAFVDLLLEKPT